MGYLPYQLLQDFFHQQYEIWKCHMIHQRERDRETLFFRPETSWHVRWSVKIYLWGSGNVKATWSRSGTRSPNKWNGGCSKIRNSRFQLQPFTTLAPLISSAPVPCPTQSRLIGLPQKRSSGGHSNRNGGRCSELPTTASRFGYSLIGYRHNPREFYSLRSSAVFFPDVFVSCIGGYFP